VQTSVIKSAFTKHRWGIGHMLGPITVVVFGDLNSSRRT